ncbi:unnamed protein product [Paramecium sonneborni]|uniref:Tetratricopeptide repeat protein n=1 Tax=Paramecium sonneborni TaxID=65129 RepID=A0A8S1R7L5_9CILI|nr:unnamed protein product [Paramecium sonneborni]
MNHHPKAYFLTPLSNLAKVTKNTNVDEEDEAKPFSLVSIRRWWKILKQNLVAVVQDQQREIGKINSFGFDILICLNKIQIIFTILEVQVQFNMKLDRIIELNFFLYVCLQSVNLMVKLNVMNQDNSKQIILNLDQGGRFIQLQYQHQNLIQINPIHLAHCVALPQILIRLKIDMNSKKKIDGQVLKDSIKVKAKILIKIKQMNKIVLIMIYQNILVRNHFEIFQCQVFVRHEIFMVQIDGLGVLSTQQSQKQSQYKIIKIHQRIYKKLIYFRIQVDKKKHIRNIIHQLNLIVKMHCIKNRAILFKDINNNEEAFEDSNYSILLDSTSATSYKNRAIFYKTLNKKIEAIKAYKKSIQLDPNISDAYMNRAQFKQLQQLQLFWIQANIKDGEENLIIAKYHFSKRCHFYTTGKD